MQNETKHTAGPWKAGPVHGVEGKAVFFTDTEKPGKWQRRLDDKAGRFSEADAALIAAAPDLLGMLCEAVRLSEAGRVMPFDTLRAAVAVIAAAKGGAK
jgi:hypothetical protein